MAKYERPKRPIQDFEIEHFKNFDIKMYGQGLKYKRETQPELYEADMQYHNDFGDFLSEIAKELSYGQSRDNKEEK